MTPPLGMKAQAVELVVDAMRNDGAPQWAIDATVERLSQSKFWFAYLTIVNDVPRTRAFWSKDEDHKWDLQRKLEEAGHCYWTAPIADIVDDHLWKQYLNWRDRRADFDREFPAPVEATVRQS